MPRKKTRNFQGRDFSKDREPDKISKKKRSSVMSKIRSQGTKFETDFVDQLSSRTKKSFRLNAKDIKGKPDIVFDQNKVCIFLDSDFWHGWQYPRWKHLLKNDFWRNKIEANRARDKKNTSWLRRNGWTVIRIWEHNISKNVSNELEKIVNSIS
jgi:DNA mismatch endonuclease, patch repair protein